MQNMLDICTKTAKLLDLKFNVKKSMALRIGSRFNKVCQNLILDGQELIYSSEIKYLGVYIQSGHNFYCSYLHNKLKLYLCFNAIYFKSKAASFEIVCVNLLKSYCMPLVLYASEAIVPCKKDVKMLDKLIFNAMAKIFCTFDAEIISDIRMNFELHSVTDIVDKRHRRFCIAYNFKQFYFGKTIKALNCNIWNLWHNTLPSDW